MRIILDSKIKTLCKCKLSDGSIHIYDFAAKTKSAETTAYSNLHLMYLGTGRIYRVDGVIQDFTEQLHFWRKR